MNFFAKKEGCTECGFCTESVCRRGNDKDDECFGCGACFLACPYSAVQMVPRKTGNRISIKVDGHIFTVSERETVRQALETLGFVFGKYPHSSNKQIFAPCDVGGCFSCAVDINGALNPSCITPVREGIEIRTNTSSFTPMRLVHGFSGHGVGGVGTPWNLKNVSGYIEAACFAAGCNFRCPQCQNWTTTYWGKGTPLTPGEAALLMTGTRKKTSVDRMAISGGESTLNRPWLVQYIRELKRLNPDKNARFHVDTNGSILTSDYIDELVDVGMTDIGIDLKSLQIDTFVRITHVEDRNLAACYMNTAWGAVKYIHDTHNSVFLGVGFPYNRELISIEEIEQMGEKLKTISPRIQVTVLDYRPEFRNLKIKRPGYAEMKQIHGILKDIGFKTVVCQTMFGHIGP
jgi:pyruvate formate lyase activating enzyme